MNEILWPYQLTAYLVFVIGVSLVAIQSTEGCHKIRNHRLFCGDLDTLNMQIRVKIPTIFKNRPTSGLQLLYRTYSLNIKIIGRPIL